MLRMLDAGRTARIKKSLDLSFVASEMVRVCPCTTKMVSFRLRRMNHPYKNKSAIEIRWALEDCPDIVHVVKGGNTNHPTRVYMTKEHYDKHYANLD